MFETLRPYTQLLDAENKARLLRREIEACEHDFMTFLEGPVKVRRVSVSGESVDTVLVDGHVENRQCMACGLIQHKVTVERVGDEPQYPSVWVEGLRPKGATL